MESNQSKYILCYYFITWNFLIRIPNNINISYINQEKSAMKDDKISTVGELSPQTTFFSTLF